MKKALIAAAVAGAFAAPSAMAAELSTNIYWSQAISFGETTTTDRRCRLNVMDDTSLTAVVTDL